MSKKTFFFSSESVGEGHPDKLCDQVSDAILDACLAKDKHAKVAMETAVKTGMLVLLGEVSVEGINFEQIARDVCKDVGYTSEEVGLDAENMNVIVNVDAQSKEIAAAVHSGGFDENLGAGDQGLMFGYATNEWDTETLHPYSHYLSNELITKMEELRKNGEISWLRPDCKSQVTLEYDQATNKPIRCVNVLISTQHNPDVTNEEISSVLKEKIISQIIPAELITEETKYFLNPSGAFVEGGPKADAGLTGRKIIVDTYGGWAPHGGGAFSGKDPTKVDRSAAYYSRYVAKSVVAAGLADRCLIQVAYSIGVSEPLSVHVETYGTAKEGRTAEQIEEIIHKNFDFRPFNIISELNLLQPIYRQTSKGGHFGNKTNNYPWETPKTDLNLEL